MADFLCRTHATYFRSQRALDEHIQTHHTANEGMVHCAYRDTSIADETAARARRRQSFADISSFVGVGLTRWDPPASSVGKLSGQEEALMTTVGMLHESPRVISEAVRGMRSRSMRTLYPDVHVRYTHVMRGIDASSRLKRLVRIKRAVFSILLPPPS